MESTGYEELGLLGQGSCSKVYKVRNISTGEECVMKIISTKKIDQVMFQNEVAIMEKINALSSSYFVKYITSYVREKELEYVIIMEYCSGGSLKEIIEEYKKKGDYIPENMVVKFMEQILSGVMTLHKNRILHKNLKPGNILVDANGNLKLSDFRISGQLSNFRISDQSSDSIACTEIAEETLYYSSPEVLKGEEYNFCADVWSLGCIFHELCCLKPPCTEKNILSFIEWWKENRYDEYEIPESYSDGIVDLIVPMLNYNRKLRPTCEFLLSYQLFKEIRLKKTKVDHLKSEDKDEDQLKSKGKGKGKLKCDKIHGQILYYWADGNEHEEEYKDDENDEDYDEENDEAIVYNEDRYEGELKDGGRDGKGILYLANGDKYEGEFKDDEINGKGIYRYANGNKYEGEFKDGKKDGKGVFYFSNGDKHEGEYKDGLAHGKGTHYLSNGGKFEGEFKYDKRDGKGILYLPNGNKYEGEYKDNKMSGKGIFYWADGDRYEGEFENNTMDGKGVFYYSNGNRYEGEYKGGKMNGKGVYYYGNGNRYEGEYKDGKENGKKIYYFADGNRCEVEYKDGKKNGKEIYYFTNGNRYEGEYKDGNKDGEKIYYYANGNRYEAEYKDGNRNDKGTLYKSSEKKCEIL